MIQQEIHKQVSIELNDVTLQGNLVVPESAIGIIVFSHGSGSSRLSPRNNYVARFLQGRGLATLLFDLLTESEDSVYETRFNIELLTKRLIAATNWVRNQPKINRLPIGYFGASTGAASALRAAAFFGKKINTVVSRGGRPDMAMAELHKVTAPTILIVGGWDNVVIELNKEAYAKLRCERKLEIVSEASHLFEEAGKLEEVAKLSAHWFVSCITSKKDTDVLRQDRCRNSVGRKTEPF